jgi:hypothetical protein
MKTLWQRLHWALVGYKAKPWPDPSPEPELVDMQSPIPMSSLRGTLKLAADLLAPHFQSAISASAYADSNGIFLNGMSGILSSRRPPGDLLRRYEAPATCEEEVDIFLSSAAWLAREGFQLARTDDDVEHDPYAYSKRELRRLFEAAVKDVYE